MKIKVLFESIDKMEHIQQINRTYNTIKAAVKDAGYNDINLWIARPKKFRPYTNHLDYPYNPHTIRDVDNLVLFTISGTLLTVSITLLLVWSSFVHNMTIVFCIAILGIVSGVVIMLYDLYNNDVVKAHAHYIGDFKVICFGVNTLEESINSSDFDIINTIAHEIAHFSPSTDKALVKHGDSHYELTNFIMKNFEIQNNQVVAINKIDMMESSK